MLKQLIVVPSAAVMIVAASGSVYAAFDPTMYSVGSSLTSIASLNQSLDIASTSYNFPTQSQFSMSGHRLMIGPVTVDQTGLVSSVYTVTQASTFTKGVNSITLNPGDMIWAYTITHVTANPNTVKSIQEFQAGGGLFAPPGTDLMDASLIIGRGTLAPTAGVAAPSQELAGDLETISFGGPVLHASLDWSWSQGQGTANQLLNDQTITLLMFTHAANIGNGIANMFGNPAQAGAADPDAQGAPILIPITIPAPGSAGVFIGGFALLAGRRRR